MRLLVPGFTAALLLMSAEMTLAAYAASPTPQIFFPKPAADTLGIIARGCAEDGQAVTSLGGDSVICEMPLGLWLRIAARFLLRDPFAPSPRAFFRYLVTPGEPGAATVTFSGWVQDSRQPAVRHTQSLAGRNFEVWTQNFLLSLGGRRTPA